MSGAEYEIRPYADADRDRVLELQRHHWGDHAERNAAFRERRDLLKRTLYPEDEMIFSGQEREGYIVFYPLDFDVEDFEIHIRDMVLRFDYRNRPVETIDIAYPFTREVYLARQPKEQ